MIYEKNSLTLQAVDGLEAYGRQSEVGLDHPGRVSHMQVCMCKNKFWDKFSKKPNNKFIHVDLHVDFPARAAQADSFPAARTPRLLILISNAATTICL